MMVSIACLDLEVDHQDAGPWRCYELTTHGKTFNECYDNAVIQVIDQDGGELDTFKIEDANDDVYDAATEAIKKELVKLKTEVAMEKVNQLIDAFKDRKLEGVKYE